MSTVFIFHGIQGHSQENWFPWLKRELEAIGHRAIVPDFPHADAPVLEEWLAHLEKYKDSIDEQTVFIGHSLGATLALRALEHMSQSIAAAVLVAPVWTAMGNEFDSKMTTFTETAYDWIAIKNHCPTFSLMYSENDPYISSTLSLELAANLGVLARLVAGAGHFNEQAGYTQFPLLLEELKAVLQ